MQRKIFIVGNPNVGKSVIFGRLTGIYATVSNYPGTTVELAHGTSNLSGMAVEIIDTPGMYSLLPITDEERVARKILLKNPGGIVVQVVDARNLARMLPLTLQLLRAKFRLIVAVNMMDEASRAGLGLNLSLLSSRLGVPIIGTTATKGDGIPELKAALTQAILTSADTPDQLNPKLDPSIQDPIEVISNILSHDYPLPPHAIAALIFGGDENLRDVVKKQEGLGRWQQIQWELEEASRQFQWGPGYQLAIEEHALAQELLKGVLVRLQSPTSRWREWLSLLTADPWSGFPILLGVIYFGLYLFVGRFGAGTLVDLLDRKLFQDLLIPASESLVSALISSNFWQGLFIGEYGVITLGVRYAVAIILPIVGCFFFFFSVLEDSGYLPRLAMLMDRTCKKLGLNGRAVIPLVLGLGCGTMATLTTRILETKRERIIATFLLALAIPCSAQLGVILALLSPYPGAVLVWASIVLIFLILSGHLLGRLLPGNPPLFYMEVPPLRLPKMSNILVKTFSRMQWYFLEILPIFIGVSVAVWIGQATGVFQGILDLLRPAVRALGLPKEAAVAFLFGFFRRDYGAAGLFDLARSGAISPRNLVVSAVTLTLFLPCIAQFAVMWKERGPVTALLITGAILPIAFSAGYLVNLLLLWWGM